MGCARIVVGKVRVLDAPFCLLIQFVHEIPHMSEIIWCLSLSDWLIDREQDDLYGDVRGRRDRAKRKKHSWNGQGPQCGDCGREGA